MLRGNLGTLRDSMHYPHLIGQFVDLLASDWLNESPLLRGGRVSLLGCDPPIHGQ